MMPIEKQVTNLELSKKLRELGVPQESYFYYNRPTNLAPYQIVYGTFTWTSIDEEGKIAAFTCSELFEGLPEVVEIDGYSYVLVIGKREISYRNKAANPSTISRVGGSFADRLAGMRVYLLENGILKPERLTP